MKKNKTLALYAIIGIIIIAGIIVWAIKGFNFEEQYSARKQIRIDNNTAIEESKIKEIAVEVLGSNNFTVNKVENFGNSALITAKEITEENKVAIVEKVNESYNSNISSDNVEILTIEHTRIRDILKPYILPGILTLALITLYSIIRFRKLGVLKVLLKNILIPVITEILFYSIVAITRIPFGELTTSIAIGIYVLTIVILTFKFENGLSEIAIEENKKEN